MTTVPSSVEPSPQTTGTTRRYSRIVGIPGPTVSPQPVFKPKPKKGKEGKEEFENRVEDIQFPSPPKVGAAAVTKTLSVPIPHFAKSFTLSIEFDGFITIGEGMEGKEATVVYEVEIEWAQGVKSISDLGVEKFATRLLFNTPHIIKKKGSKEEEGHAGLLEPGGGPVNVFLEEPLAAGEPITVSVKCKESNAIITFAEVQFFMSESWKEEGEEEEKVKVIPTEVLSSPQETGVIHS
jgi:hypothetical protein